MTIINNELWKGGKLKCICGFCLRQPDHKRQQQIMTREKSVRSCTAIAERTKGAKLLSIVWCLQRCQSLPTILRFQKIASEPPLPLRCILMQVIAYRLLPIGHR